MSDTETERNMQRPTACNCNTPMIEEKLAWRWGWFTAGAGFLAGFINMGILVLVFR